VFETSVAPKRGSAIAAGRSRRSPAMRQRAANPLRPGEAPMRTPPGSHRARPFPGWSNPRWVLLTSGTPGARNRCPSGQPVGVTVLRYRATPRRGRAATPRRIHRDHHTYASTLAGRRYRHPRARSEPVRNGERHQVCQGLSLRPVRRSGRRQLDHHRRRRLRRPDDQRLRRGRDQRSEARHEPLRQRSDDSSTDGPPMRSPSSPPT
jgi:hypothetical protein